MTDAERLEIARGAARAVRPHAQRDDLDDMVQDALIAAWRAEQTWDGRGTLSGRCYAKAKGAVIDGLRQRAGRGNGRTVGPRKLVTPSDPATLRGLAAPDDPEREVIARMELDRFMAWRATLPPRRAEAVMAYEDQQSVAERHGIGRSAVAQMRKAALALYPAA